MKKQDEWVTGNVTLSIGGKPLRIDMAAPATPVTARQMLPVLQHVTNAFVDFRVDAEREIGKEVSCKAGCGACCRQPVPIAEAEAYALGAYVDSLPALERKELETRFEVAMEALRETRWFERFAERSAVSLEERRGLAVEYFDMEIACPFLVEESCSIHEIRPLACREYLVTSPSENCAAPSPGTIDMIPLPTKASYALRRITKADSTNGRGDYLLLVAALEFARGTDEPRTRHTGEEWLSSFFQTLSDVGAS